MDYKRLYKSLIESRKILNRSKKDVVYFEQHHILPKSLGGGNEKDNLVLLTGKEHFIAHLLLTKCYEGEAKRKMNFAFWRLCSSRQFKNKISARQYSLAKELLTLAKTGTTMSEEARQKIKNKRKLQVFSEASKLKKIITLKKLFAEGKKVLMKGKTHSEETKKKMSISQKGRVMSDQTKEKISKSNLGRKVNEVGRKNMSEAHLGLTPWNKGLSINTTCPHCGKVGNYRVMPRWHFDNCKLINNKSN